MEMEKWKSFRYEYDASGKLLYRARHKNANADPNSQTWEVEKFNYDEAEQVVDRKTWIGSWNNKAF